MNNKNITKFSVLIVNNDKTILRELEMEMKKNFFITHTASNGKTALETIKQEKINIMLLDIKLPDMNGLEVIKEAKEKDPECEIIIITGFGMHDIAVRAVEFGAIDYIEKPIDLEKLNIALGRARENLISKESKDYIYTLLVIDDDVNSTIMLKKILEKERYNVLTANSGKDGLKIIEENKVYVVITDIRMEEMDGIEFLKRAKQLYPEIEGVMITGIKDHKVAIKALRTGAIDYINKPIDPEELTFSVHKALERIELNSSRQYRLREQKIRVEVFSKINEELEKKIEERMKELRSKNEELKKSNKKLKETTMQLIQSAKLSSLGEMTAGVAHEMNQPLNNINLTSQSMLMDMERNVFSEQEIKADLHDIIDEVKRMSGIIDHMRIFTRKSDDNSREKIDINSVVGGVFKLLGQQLKVHNFEVKKDLDPNLPEILADQGELGQVFTNLIVNARDAVEDFRETERKIEIKSYQSQKGENQSPEIIVEVKDNGGGISDEIKDRILEPFFTTKAPGKGTGLGLSIVDRIVKEHHGRIEMESREGEGSLLRVILPVGD